MMVFTHILVGGALGLGVSMATGVDVQTAVLVGMAGGFLPDVDMLFTHRKTLHFPVVYALLAAIAGVLSVFTGLLLLAGLFALAAWLHSIMDTLGGGKEMRPWRETDDRAVYDHVSGRWIAPIRLFYDGSLPDLGVAVLLGAVLLGLLQPPALVGLVVGLLVLSVVYTAFRKLITKWIPEEYPTFSSYIQNKLTQSPKE